ncbi:universal stress protein [Propionicimonas sp.]|uniref:universal stress protein n=1 Tax=Propionicimonas sp. TaxID=1955623 RepID=UPI0017F2A542|nr:universal stress protein [Propionicimonas sp.]MBU3975803.1 universal stress protein [Actinomycetota bacterium]MBA3022208.1 universal stress protein [Propionicimonas sp.]MBU3987353.1 universal stress protein [Actinomycetota bacterium]MBU4006428.1 universal stress protein [Actinomycetota bacterium]MBU4065307.1 universal stress protein [Actinomycetota bacterium]
MDQPAAIIIGFDDSATAKAALHRGLDLAAKYGVKARVLRAWTFNNAPRPKTWEPGYVPPVEDFAAAVLEKLSAQVAPLLAEFSQVEVSLEAPHGPAGRELVQASAEAQLVVIGNRGLSGLPELVLGSVSHEVVEHAHCDVLVVRKR